MAMAALRTRLRALVGAGEVNPDIIDHDEAFTTLFRAVFAEAAPGDKSAIKRAYRSMSILLHPDKVKRRFIGTEKLMGALWTVRKEAKEIAKVILRRQR